MLAPAHAPTMLRRRSNHQAALRTEERQFRQPVLTDMDSVLDQYEYASYRSCDWDVRRWRVLADGLFHDPACWDYARGFCGACGQEDGVEGEW